MYDYKENPRLKTAFYIYLGYPYNETKSQQCFHAHKHKHRKSGALRYSKKYY